MLRLGVALCLMALFLNAVPYPLMLWLLAIPGLLVWWCLFLLFGFWLDALVDH